jgi:hypothetical protein
MTFMQCDDCTGIYVDDSEACDCETKLIRSLQARVKEMENIVALKDTLLADVGKYAGKLRKVVDAARAIKGILEQHPGNSLEMALRELDGCACASTGTDAKIKCPHGKTI